MTAGYKKILPRDSEFWEACARHRNRATTRFISTLFLCDHCTERLTRDCFNGRPPIYHGDTIEGYCGLCNQATQVTLRQWFICPICLNVVHSYPKAIAATRFVHEFWANNIAPILPLLRLKEADIVQIEPFIPGRRSQKVKARTVEALDFLVSEIAVEEEHPVFFIELKTGPSQLEDMKEFQLDVNDFNDIATVAKRWQVPVYVFHIQVVEEYRLPTRRSIAKNLWWTDIFTLREHLKAVKRRRGEDKDAGYYEPKAFRSIQTFVAELKAKRYKELRDRLLKEGIADLPGRNA